MNFRQYIENSLEQLEKLLHHQVTVIDYDGIFNYKQPQSVFSNTRRSHQTNVVCKAGFCDKCITCCRHENNRIGQEHDGAFYATCWKGLGQLAVPLHLGQQHCGLLYAGMYRDAKLSPPKDLPADFYAAYKKLPLYTSDELDRLGGVLQLFADGMMHFLLDKNILNSNYDFRINKINQFLQDNYGNNIGLPDLAASLGLSNAYASDLISRLYGRTFRQLLRTTRINQARKLLLTSDERLRNIAIACGFNNEFHFSKVFKELTGITPSHFRLTNQAPTKRTPEE